MVHRINIPRMDLGYDIRGLCYLLLAASCRTLSFCVFSCTSLTQTDKILVTWMEYRNPLSSVIETVARVCVTAVQQTWAEHTELIVSWSTVTRNLAKKHPFVASWNQPRPTRTCVQLQTAVSSVVWPLCAQTVPCLASLLDTWGDWLNKPSQHRLQTESSCVCVL